MLKEAFFLLVSLCVAQSAVIKPSLQFPISAFANIKGSLTNETLNVTSHLTGKINFEQFTEDGGVFITVDLQFDMPIEDKTILRGIHIHSKVISNGDCSTAGGHWNPKKVTHGLLTSSVHHAGDLGNFMFTPEGLVHSEVRSFDLSLFGEESIIGRSVVVHQKIDDGGLGNAPSSKKSGNAGPKIACGSIVSA